MPESKTQRGRRSDGSTTKRVTFSGAAELIDRLYETADIEGSSVSRLLDRVIRNGFAAEEHQAENDRVATRIDAAIARLERIPYGGAKTAFAVLEEQLLLGAAMTGQASALPVIQVLNSVAFSHAAHARSWSLLQGDIEPGEGAARTIARMIEPQYPQVFDVPVEKYLTGLADASARLEGESSNAAFRVMDAYLLRATIGDQSDAKSDIGKAATRLLDVIGKGLFDRAEKAVKDYQRGFDQQLPSVLERIKSELEKE